MLQSEMVASKIILIFQGSQDPYAFFKYKYIWRF